MFRIKGTLRHNLDPWDAFPDDDLWRVRIQFLFILVPGMNPGLILHSNCTPNAAITNSGTFRLLNTSLKNRKLRHVQFTSSSCSQIAGVV